MVFEKILGKLLTLAPVQEYFPGLSNSREKYLKNEKTLLAHHCIVGCATKYRPTKKVHG